MSTEEQNQIDESIISLPVEPSTEFLRAIAESADVIACECPGYLVRLLRQIRNFHRYTEGCIEQFPQDEATHRWLCEQAEVWEGMVFQTIVELMQREGLVDENNQISLSQLADRARSIAYKQVFGS